MRKVGEYVSHTKCPEEYGIGIVKDNIKSGFILVKWENEFGETWEEEMQESELN
jgi:hypothetical protein